MSLFKDRLSFHSEQLQAFQWIEYLHTTAQVSLVVVLETIDESPFLMTARELHNALEYESSDGELNTHFTYVIDLMSSSIGDMTPLIRVTADQKIALTDLGKHVLMLNDRLTQAQHREHSYDAATPHSSSKPKRYNI